LRSPALPAIATKTCAWWRCSRARRAQRDSALAGITRIPAEILGVAERVGSLTPGRDADLVVLTADPFDITRAFSGLRQWRGCVRSAATNFASGNATTTRPAPPPS